MDLRALTFNIRFATDNDEANAWRFRRPGVLEFLAALDCGVLGFQEVLPEQRDDLESFLPDFTWIGHGRDADKGGEQCCMAISPLFEIQDSGTFWLCTTPDVPGTVGWDAQLTRVCTWARLAQRDVSFTVFNSHWDHKGELARMETARLLFDRIMAVPGPVILMGDFNATPDSAPVQLLTTILQDSVGESHGGRPLPTFHGFGRVVDGPRIDYLLASPEFLVVETRIYDEMVGPPYLSDHFPVFGRYELIP